MLRLAFQTDLTSDPDCHTACPPRPRSLLTGVCLFPQRGVWETLLAALGALIRAEHQQQLLNVRQLLEARVVHHFLLTCQVLQVRFLLSYSLRCFLQLLLLNNSVPWTQICVGLAGEFFSLPSSLPSRIPSNENVFPHALNIEYVLAEDRLCVPELAY